MEGYIILELQTNDQGQTSILDTQKDTRAEADNKYYTVLAAAAISSVPVHAAVMLTKDGGYVVSKAYDHRTSEVEG